VDICPVGALTERRFRFKARVWYLSSAPTVCNGCSKGCNMDMHYVLDRPHLNDGARVVRVKPRHNSDVNEWWLCDEGRYGLGWIDEDRLQEVRGPSGSSTWDDALTAIEGGLKGARVGVIASAQLTNEDLFLIKHVFADAKISAAVPEQPGTSDELLIQADKNPNSEGARVLGLLGAGVPEARSIVDAAIAGELDALWVFGHDLVELYGEDTALAVAEKVGLFIFSGTNENATAALAHWCLPTAAYVEKDGTFVNCDGRVQRVGLVFAPLPEARTELSLLGDLAARLDRPLQWTAPEQVFEALAAAEPAFAGLSYEKLGELGAPTARSEPAVGAATT
jgi:NADH-quinone oxidoreductase subunit G